MDRRDTDKWTLRKEISIGNLLAIVTGIACVASAYFQLDKRVAIVEEAVAREEVRFNRMEDSINWLVHNAMVKRDEHGR